MQVAAAGFIIGVLKDSTETALKSSSDALFAAEACLRAKRLDEEAAKKGRALLRLFEKRDHRRRLMQRRYNEADFECP